MAGGRIRPPARPAATLATHEVLLESVRVICLKEVSTEFYGVNDLHLGRGIKDTEMLSLIHI